MLPGTPPFASRPVPRATPVMAHEVCVVMTLGAWIRAELPNAVGSCSGGGRGRRGSRG